MLHHILPPARSQKVDRSSSAEFPTTWYDYLWHAWILQPGIWQAGHVHIIAVLDWLRRKRGATPVTLCLLHI